ncbi:phage tail assembly chaperone [Pseudomonas sp. SBB6]|uniref:phage tail assembly chaperone n=1 Tax=Pseudomonas sp. SBB6 TaxID=2962032 RepID=UPI0020B66311|nr:phage tail assembly chaperone [Pseudomonas sp. SBB6]MCP3749615.1 phage tail assembly chaperone [Pseudomonas sp. SBB6]
MHIFYSHASGGFYAPCVHSEMPADSVALTDKQYQALKKGLELGKRIGLDVDGVPILIDPPPLSAEEVAAMERKWRDSQLVATQWLVARYSEEQSLSLATTNTPEQIAVLLGYRQSLRDWPQSEVFPDTRQRPVAPPWIAEQVQ